MNAKVALILFAGMILSLSVTTASGQEYALSFDGANDLVEVSDNSVLSGGAGKDITVEAWVKPASLTDYQPVVVKFEDYRTKDYGLRVTQDGGIQVDIENNSDDWLYAAGSGIIQVDVWAHIAFTFDNAADTVRLYINGSEVGGGAFLAKDMPDSPASLMIGRNNYVSRFFEGEIDEVRIWNVARSAAELQSTMGAILTGSESGLIGYWKLDEGNGQTAADATANGNNGRLGRNSGPDSGDPAWVVSTAPVGDNDPPVISNVSAINISEDAATITWQTDEFSDSQVEYGLDTSYGNLTSLDPTLVLSHSVEVTGLSPSQSYHFRVLSRDPSGNLAVSGDFTFTTSAPDLTPPLISNVSSSNVTSSGASILWNTDEPSDSQVEYGLDANYGNITPLDPTLVTSHNVTLSSLSQNTTYHYSVRSRDASGNLAQSGDFTFTTEDTPGGGAGFALSYDGNDDFLHIDDTELLSGGSGKSITVEAWINLASLATDNPIVSKFLDAFTKDWGLKVEADGSLQVDIENNGDNWAYKAGSVSANVWTHVAFTFDNPADLVRIYVNGVQAGSGATLTKNMPNSSAPVRVGNSEYNNKFFTGEIDEVRIWSSVRTASELQANMNAVLTGTEPGLIGYWKFDEGSGQLTADLTGNGQDGRLGTTTGSNSSDPAWVQSTAPIDGNDFITVSAPNGGETWVTNSNQTITWNSNIGGSVRIELSEDGGASWSDITASTANDGSYSWTVPANINSSNCLIRISDAADGDPSDVSDGPFTIDSSLLLSFSDITTAAGMGGVTQGGHAATVSDVDENGRPDIYITSLVTNTASSDLFFHNKGSNTFVEEAGTRGIADFDGGSHGAVFADLDNDGDLDLFNGTTGLLDENGAGTAERNNIYRNDGNGFFTDITDSIGITLPQKLTRGVAAFDMDNDGDLDLFAVTNFMGSNDPPGETNEIYRNDGNMQFTAITNGDLYTAPAGQGATDTDYDGDGDIDIIAGNRTGDLNILNNDGNGNFTLISPSSIGITHRGKEGASMGDIDNDGDLDMLLADFDDVNNFQIKHLYRNDGDGTFTFVTTFQDMNGYMGGFADLDNDGDLDLVGAGDERAFLNDGSGNFTPGPTIPVSGISDPRAIAFLDADQDGDLDFVVGAKGSRNWLVRNNAINAGNWLKVKLISPWGQNGAFGAKTRIYEAGNAGGTLLAMRESRSAHGYLGQNDPVLHFGLDSRQAVDVVTTFLDGTTVTVPNVSANQTLVIDALTENLLVTSPNGGEIWSPGSSQVITWNSSGNLTSVAIELSSDGGANWSTVVSNTTNDGSYNWTVSNVQSSNCLIRVSDAADGDPSDVSDASFSIETDTTPPLISSVAVGNIGNNTATITWNTDEPADTQVEYGLTTTYGNLSSLDPTLVTGHTVVLNGLSENTTYHFRALSRDASGNLAQGSDFTFTTTNTPGGGAGYALSYDGADDFVEIADTQLLSGGNGKSITVEAWIKVTSLATDGPIISKFLDANTKDWGLKVEVDSSLQVDIENNGDNWAYNAGSVSANVWTHVAFTFDNPADLVRIYVNGVQAASGATLSKNMPNSSAPVRIGNSKYNSKFFTGEIDEVRIWNFARSASELQSTMNDVLSGNEPGLIGYWTFDENSGQTTADLTSNGQDGRLGTTTGSNSSDPTWILSQAPLSGDETPPVISNVASGNIGETTATITWNTDEPSDSQVEYGTNTSYGNFTTLDPTLQTSHTVNLSGLTSSTTYHFRVLSRDAAGNLATSADFTFITSAPDVTPPVISNVNSTNVSSASATIEWTTDEISDSQVEYGLDTNYGNSTPVDPSLVTSHSLLLSGLLADTTYHYLVKSRDASGNLATSGDFTFTTQPGGITQSGFAMNFDGVDDYVTIAENELLSGGSGKSITVEAWVMVSSLSQDAPIVNKYLDAFFKDWGLQVKTDSSLQVDIENNGDNWFYGAGNVPVSVWTHVAFTFDNAADEVKLFINGSEVGSGATLSKNMPNTSADIRIGSVEYNQSFCDGFIDEVRIWDFARSEAEIQSTMDSKLAGNEPGLIGYWDFETGSGQTVVDRTGNGNDGQLGPTSGSEVEDPVWFALPLVPFLDLTFPDGGETLYFGSVLRVEWDSNPLISEVNVELSTNSGTSWQTIGSNVPNSEGFYDWEIPWNLTSSNSLIRISDADDGNPSDVSNSVFAIDDLFTTNVTLPDLKQWVGPSPGGLLDAEIRVSGGETRLQFSGTSINTGIGDLDLQGTFNNQGLLPAYQRVYNSNGTFEDIYVGTFEFATHPNHNHFHLQDFNIYRLREMNPDSSVGSVVVTSDKVSFCITDSDPYDLSLPGAAQQPVYSCEDQGTSIGWGDLYDKNTYGQWIVIDNVPSGTYWLEAEVNPDSVVFETDLNNNIERVLIDMDKSTGTVTVLNYNPPSVYSQHVNSGGPLLQTGGKRWEADQPFSLGSWGYTGGHVVSTSDDIKGTSEDELYHDQREGMTSYRFTVPTVADYRVDLHFAEIVYNAPGQRVFDVYLEDTLILDDLDLFATLGHDSLKIMTFQEQVSDGILDITFDSVTGEPLVGAINVVEMLPTSSFVLVNAPNGGETFGQGSTQTISWSSSGGIDNVMIEFSENGGTSWSTVTASTPNTGTYSWNVSNTTTNNGLIRITDVDDAQITDVSDNPFTINQQITLGNMDIVFNTDDEYELYVNGNFVGSNTQWNQAQSYSVPLLSGKNVLAVLGVNGGGPAGVLGEVRYNGQLIFLTDSQWKRTENPPANWQDPNLDDSSWLNAVDFGPYTGNVNGFPANSSARWIWLDSASNLEGYFRGTFYAGAPQVTSVAPGSGGAGTEVTITGSNFAGSVNTLVPTQTVSIMPLGDSITNGVTGSTDNAGYRNDLAGLLDAQGIQYDLVGGLQSGTGFDNDHEGHNGYWADEVLAEIDAWLNANPPDIILLHIGTNDISSGQSNQSTIDEIEAILDHINTFDPGIYTILASIVPRKDANDPETTTLNGSIGNLVTNKYLAGYNVYYAAINEEFKSNLNWADDYYPVGENIHPNDAGYAVMAGVWFDEILKLYNSAASLAVTFNGTNATGVVIDTVNQLRATVPTGASTGPVSVSNLYGTGTSGSNFNVTSSAATLALSLPAGGEQWTSESKRLIAWRAPKNVESVTLEFSGDGGVSWQPLAKQVKNTGKYIWNVPDVTSEEALVRVSNPGHNASAVSGRFSVSPKNNVLNMGMMKRAVLGELDDEPELKAKADLNSDGNVNLFDFLQFFDSATKVKGKQPTLQKNGTLAQDRGVQIPTPQLHTVKDTGVELPLKLLGETPIRGFQIEIEYDNSRIELSDLLPYSNEYGMILHAAVVGNKVKVFGYLMKANSAVEVDNTLLTLTGSIKDDFDGQADVSIKEAMFASKENQPVAALLNAAEAAGEIPTDFSLQQNYPNPFNLSTQIKYNVPAKSKVKLEIFNLKGELVRTLLDNKEIEAGQYRIEWDGKNERGVVVASGIYIYRMKAGKFEQAKRMTLIK